MLLETVLAAENGTDIDNLVSIAKEAGQKSIKEAKLDAPDYNQDITFQEAYYMSITLVRVDDRVIHGQTMTRWSKERSVDAFLVIGNSIVSDQLRKKGRKRFSKV